jgi:hypothetical protein
MWQGNIMGSAEIAVICPAKKIVEADVAHYSRLYKIRKFNEGKRELCENCSHQSRSVNVKWYSRDLKRKKD